MPSIVDRMIDPEAGGTNWRRGYGEEQIMKAVQRDLADLLNTRQSHMGLPEQFTEIHDSLIAYGLPDLTSIQADTTQQREDIGRILETIIARFEPRLKDIRASLMPSEAAQKERTVRYRVEARLRVDPAPAVAFDTILELTTGHYTIQSSDARL